MHIALSAGKACYLPILNPIRIPPFRNTLWFARFRPNDRLRPNRLGIQEPTSPLRLRTRARRLDLILVPLVGFDADCHRIGMGGGFYDRTLGPTRKRSRRHHPRLIGIAHECQRLAAIAPNPWDVQLDAVVSESGIYSRPPLDIAEPGL